MSTLHAGTFSKFYCILAYSAVHIFFLLHLAFIAEVGGENETARRWMEFIYTRAVGLRKILQPSNFLGMKNISSQPLDYICFICVLPETDGYTAVMVSGCSNPQISTQSNSKNGGRLPKAEVFRINC